MRRKELFLLSAVGLALMLILTLQWTTGGLGSPVVAAPPAAIPAVPLDELHVCPAGPPTCDYTDIQSAVDAATHDTTIKVAAGVYTDIHVRESITQVVYISKSVTIQGGFSPPDWATPDYAANPTVLDARGLGRVIVITGFITPTLEGLTITGGDATGLSGGPGAYDGAGGGIYVDGAPAHIYECTIYGNVAGRNGWSAGGGVYLWDSYAALWDNTVYSNIAGTGAVVALLADDGGSILPLKGQAFLAGEGGGLALSGGLVILGRNTIRNNTAASDGPGLGGGIYMEGGLPLLYSNVVQDNTASLTDYGQGGGIYDVYNNARLLNTVLIGNFSGPSSGSWGAAYAAEDTSSILQHTTFHDNSGFFNNALFAFSDSTLALTNTILAGQTVGISITMDSTATLHSVLWYDNVTNTDGAGTIRVINEFSGSPRFAADGYHLLSGSAAIDKGVPVGAPPDVDIDWQERPYGSAPDLGADEWYGELVIDPAEGGTIVYTGTQGLPTIVEIPPGAVVETTTLVFTPAPTPTYPFPPDLNYGGHAFDLDAYCLPRYRVYLPFAARSYSASVTATVESLVPSPSWSSVSGSPLAASGCGLEPCAVTFEKPVTITITYADTDLTPGLKENTLKLYYWTGTEWQDAATTCDPPSSYDNDTLVNRVRVAICHLSRFALGGR